MQNIKRIGFLCLAGLLAIPFLVAQTQEPAGFQHWSAADVQSANRALVAKAAGDAHHSASKIVADFANDSVLLAHREADGTPEVHETQVDVMMIESGSATLVVGGKLQNGETVSPHEIRNGTIQGGSRVKVAAGDVFRVPANTPHQMLLDGAPQITYLVVKVKGY